MAGFGERKGEMDVYNVYNLLRQMFFKNTFE